MIPRPAQYLLRFDDLCPTFSRTRFERFLPLIQDFGIQPVLAVVPDNMDPELQVAPPDSEFWNQMQVLEESGATIGLHGYRHLCNSRGKSLVPLHRQSEFSGVDDDTQQAWIRAGLAILRGQGLSPRIWVAPRHGFDRTTVRVLREEGIGLISDGLARVPFNRGGVTWIPQQLWAPVDKPEGLWTICLHSNTARDAHVNRLRDFLVEHAQQFTSVGRVMAEFEPAGLGFGEGMRGAFALMRKRGSRIWKLGKGRLDRSSEV